MPHWKQEVRTRAKRSRSIYYLVGIYNYLLFRFHLWRAAVADGPNPSHNNFPLPPAMLRFRVHGSLDLESFVKFGQRCADDMRDILRDAGEDLYNFGKVLDFACGCGRMMRHFKQSGSTHFWGSDIDAEAIRWCQTALPFATWDVNDFVPPTRYDNNMFDFINITSLFTHLDETHQFLWLNELRRITKHNGLLLISLHGDNDARAALTTAEYDALQQAGLLFKIHRTGTWKLDGLPDEYQTTFHTKHYVHERWGQLFSIVRYVELGINDHQDAVLLRNDIT